MSASHRELKQGLSATAPVIGGIIGSGIFVAPGIIALAVGSPGLSIGIWCAAGLLAACGALCYAELGAALSESGGTYAVLRRSYRRPVVSFLFGVGVLRGGWTGGDRPSRPKESLVGVAITLAGLPLYWYRTRRVRPTG